MKCSVIRTSLNLSEFYLELLVARGASRTIVRCDIWAIEAVSLFDKRNPELGQ